MQQYWKESFDKLQKKKSNKKKQTKKAKKESKKIQPTIGKNNREKNKGEGLP